MKKISLLLLFTCVLSAAFAQQAKGDKIINLNASYARYGSLGGSFNTTFQLGKFVTRSLEIGYQGSLFLSTSISQLTPSGYMTFNVITESGKFVPYLGASAGYTSQTVTAIKTVTTTNFNFGAKAGVRTYFSENGFYDVGLNYLSSGDIDIILLNFGLGYIFRKKVATP